MDAKYIFFNKKHPLDYNTATSISTPCELGKSPHLEMKLNYLQIISRCGTESEDSETPGISRDFPNNLYETIQENFKHQEQL